MIAQDLFREQMQVIHKPRRGETRFEIASDD